MNFPVREKIGLIADLEGEKTRPGRRQYRSRFLNRILLGAPAKIEASDQFPARGFEKSPKLAQHRVIHD